MFETPLPLRGSQDRLGSLGGSDPDFPLTRLFEAGNDTQKGGFTAARRPYEDYEFTIIYLKADSMKDLGLAESLNNILEF